MTKNPTLPGSSTIVSSLRGPEPDNDLALRRLRERADRIGYDIDSGLCAGCDAQLTHADLEAGACTQCGELLTRTWRKRRRNRL